MTAKTISFHVLLHIGSTHIKQGWQSHRRASAIFVTTVKLRCDVILHSNCGCDFCCDYLNCFDAIFCVGICDYLCDFGLFRFFEQF